MDDDLLPNAEILIFSVSLGEILSSLAHLSNINDLCAPLTSRILPSTCNPPALTRITAVFSRQTLLIDDSIVGSDGTMAELLSLGFNLVSLLCLSWTFQIICYI